MVADEAEEKLRQPITARKVLLGLLYAAIACGAGGALYYYLYYLPHRPDVRPEKEAVEPFVPHLASYVEIPDLKEDPVAIVKKTYRIEKAVLVNLMDDETYRAFREYGSSMPSLTQQMGDGTWAGINWWERSHIPKIVRAESPGDVRTIVWLKWSLEKAGRAYGGVQWGRRIVCEVTIIQKDNALIVGRETTRGITPEVDTESDHIVIGPRPTKDITRLIETAAQAPKAG